LEVGRGIPVLIGFLNEVEREFFTRFISVSGVGPRAALKALTQPIPVIAKAIDEGDVELLRSLPGIGEQRAKEIVAKLQGKVGKFALIQTREGAVPSAEPPASAIEDEAVAVLRKWLTGVALEQFFEVVDQVALERMWRFRRAFWLAYYNADVINDAWVLFGPYARSYAQRAFGKTQSYGSLERGYQVQSDHSVLLMRIGKLTVADWSHNGKCHIWLDGNAAAPKLYLPRYGRSDVVHSSDNEGQVHHGSDHGTWQRQVASYIRQYTGISLPEKSYIPDGWRH
jgi:hypothetical protein